MFRDYTFTKRLAIFIGIDVAISVIDSYVPQGITPVRESLAVVMIACMAMTMGIALRRVLEDY